MWKLVDCANLRCSPKNRVSVHFLESATPIFELRAGNHFEPLGHIDRVLAPVWLKVADDVHSLLLELLRLVEHPIRLPCPGRIAEENLQTSACSGFGSGHAPVL